jgi:hypothetical protein
MYITVGSKEYSGLTEEQKTMKTDFSVFFQENVKRIRPMFMKDLKKSDKKKNHDNFDYLVFNTPMDWVAPIVLDIDRADRSPNGSVKNLVDLMDKRKLKKGEHNKIKDIFELAEDYYNKYKTDNAERRWSSANATKEGFIIELQGKSIDGDTVYHIIKKLLTDKPKYKNFLLKCLCKARMADVVNCFREIDERNKEQKKSKAKSRKKRKTSVSK